MVIIGINFVGVWIWKLIEKLDEKFVCLLGEKKFCYFNGDGFWVYMENFVLKNGRNIEN